jgi:hypothetical protein
MLFPTTKRALVIVLLLVPTAKARTHAQRAQIPIGRLPALLYLPLGPVDHGRPMDVYAPDRKSERPKNALFAGSDGGVDGGRTQNHQSMFDRDWGSPPCPSSQSTSSADSGPHRTSVTKASKIPPFPHRAVAVRSSVPLRTIRAL